MGCRPVVSTERPISSRLNVVVVELRGGGLVFVGTDGAEKHHDVCIIEQEGAILARGRVLDDVEGISKLHEMVAD